MRPPRWLVRIARRLARPPLAEILSEAVSIAELQRALGWQRPGTVVGDHLDTFEHPEDLNARRRRDAEVLAAACANAPGPTLLEIGTGLGHATTLMSRNAPQAVVHTVNVPPEEIATAGTLTTFAPDRDAIGRIWREAGCTNVRQILANSATWRPDLDRIDLAFIDGCHDESFVVHDTRLVLARSQPGTLVLWHDLRPALADRFPWIRSVCAGVERLYRSGELVGPLWHLAHSWIGVYRVSGCERRR